MPWFHILTVHRKENGELFNNSLTEIRCFWFFVSLAFTPNVQYFTLRANQVTIQITVCVRVCVCVCIHTHTIYIHIYYTQYIHI